MGLIGKVLHKTGMRVCGTDMDHDWRKIKSDIGFTQDEYQYANCEVTQKVDSDFAPPVRD